MKKVDVRKSIYAVAFVIGMLSLAAAVQVARADTWSWTNGTPTLISKEDANRNMSWVSECESRYNSPNLSVNVEGTEAPYEVNSNCLVSEGQNFKLLSYASNQSLAIQFEGDQNAHSIRGADCRQCVYLPARDMLINIERGGTVMAGRVAIYKNFVSKLRLRNTLTLNQRYYQLDQNSPDQYLGSGNVIDSKFLGRSQNDKWVVIEIIGSGFFRINMDTMEMLKFSSVRTNYTYSSNSIEFDITNDGQHIAVGGDYDNAIYDIIPGCGYVIPDAITVTEGQVNQLQQTYCPYRHITDMTGGSNTDNILYGMSNIEQLQFNDDDGGEVTFYARNLQFYKPPIKVTLRASGYTGIKALDYLALGDSYSSGEGDIDPSGVNYYRSFTDIKGDKDKGITQEKCHVSTRSYPYKLAAGMNLSLSSPKQWDAVTCSGATTQDIESKTFGNYLGQGDRLKGYNADAMKAQALNEFIPGRQQQIEFVKKYKPKVITLTIGGNDVNFSNKLQDCVLSVGTCSIVNEERSKIASEINNQYQKFVDLYVDLYKASDSKAKIYVLGYPNFINGNNDAVCGSNLLFLNNNEREMIQNSVIYLNNVIKTAAKASGVKYVDIENSLNGHRLCDNGKKYVVGVSGFIGINGYQDQGSFHPNADGHQAMASSVMETKNLNNASILSYDTCPGLDENICPDINVTKSSIEIPQYFKDVASDRNIHYKPMTNFEQLVNGTVDVTTGVYAFAANSVAVVTGRSDPVSLGEYSTASDGSLEVQFILPKEMGVGFHTITIAGKTYSGDQIEYEQSILIKGSDPNDVDADGINDSQDKCLFIQAVNKDYDADGIDDACDPVIGDPPVNPLPTTTPTPTPTPTTSPKPAPTPVSVATTVIAQIVNVIFNVILLLANLLRKLLLRL